VTEDIIDKLLMFSDGDESRRSDQRGRSRADSLCSMELSGTEDVDVVLERIQRGATGRKYEYFKYNGVKSGFRMSEMNAAEHFA
jgi:hypothetical protein